MAQPKRKPSRRQPARSRPISEHPRFAAAVALWFAALFGLGSLAVRPALVEALVLRNRIDLLIPPAAPPLGLGARIVIALLMTALGVLVGLSAARRLGAPPRATRQSGDGGQAGNGERVRGAGSTPTRAPATQPARAATIEHDATYLPWEAAPLPGSRAQILDIAGMDLDDADSITEPPHDPGTFGTAAERAAPIPPATAPIQPRQIFGMLPGEDMVAPPAQFFSPAPAIAAPMAGTAPDQPAQPIEPIQPVVVFPGQLDHSQAPHGSPPRTPDHQTEATGMRAGRSGTEHALRTALANLQRIGGTA
ncbi:MAG: hypothetical protein RLZZ84_770 [Pseudomonadota bacterium]